MVTNPQLNASKKLKKEILILNLKIKFQTISSNWPTGKDHIGSGTKIGRTGQCNARRRAEQANIGAGRRELALFSGQNNIAASSQLTAGSSS